MPTQPQVGMPSLNIFLGSTPVYAALEVMRYLVHLPEDDRRHVAIVLLDIADPPAEIAQFRLDHPEGLLVLSPALNMPDDVRLGDPLPDDILKHTFINPHTPRSDDTGAGGIRNNGHMAVCTAWSQIAQALDRAITEICTISPHEGARPIEQILVNIVAFLGGGTGSGIVGDIAVMAGNQIELLGLRHQLSMFCLLPEHFHDVTDLGLRKSNAAAALLEMLALSTAGNDQHPYRKYLRGQPFPVRGPVANEIYLYGRTDVSSAEDAIRILGLDLCTRVTNASGVGYAEMTSAVNRNILGNRDVNGLPTMFGTSCPFEVVFPAMETATAFAELNGAGALRYLTQPEPKTGPELTKDEQVEIEGWSNPFGDDLGVDKFQDIDLRPPSQERLRELTARLDDQVAQAKAKDDEKGAHDEEAERRDMSSNGLAPIGKQVHLLERRELVYKRSLENVWGKPSPPPQRLEPDRNLQRRMLSAWTAFGLKRRAIGRVIEDFNRVQYYRIQNARLKRRQELLDRLLEYVKAQIETLKRYQSNADGKRVGDMEQEAKDSPAWKGQLEHGHIHRRHLFDVSGMIPENGAPPPSEKLYRFLTTHSAETYGDRFAESLKPLYGERASLLMINAHELGDRVVEYLRDEVYLPALYEMNLIDILTECCAEAGESPDGSIEKILHKHLEHIGNLTRPLVAAEPQLTQTVPDTSLYLGMSYREGGHQEEIMKRVLGGVAFRAGGVPLKYRALDPHQMQVVFGEHGISLGIIPDFYRREGSAMSEFLVRERAWSGNGQSSAHGLSRMPVFISTEMEWLVMNPDALDDQKTDTHKKRNLPERVMR